MTLIDDLSIPLDEKEAHRRKFLSLLGAGALGVAMVGTGITTIRYLRPNAYYEADARFVVGRPEDIAPGTVLVLIKHKVYVVRTQAGVYAMSSICTHLGCLTRYNRGAHRFDCPCHGSRYALSGKVIRGPAPKALHHLQVTIDRGKLVVNAAKRVPMGTILKLPS